MRLLLDTHVAIWALTHPERLTPVGRQLIGDSVNTVYVSVASLWEITIKHALGRARAPRFSGSDAVQYFTEAGYLLLNITAAHVVAVGTLPLLHDDPFDRVLVAQALTEQMRLLTHDTKVAQYDDSVVRI